MSKFKVGDKVRVVKTKHYAPDYCIGEVAIITKLSVNSYGLMFDNGEIWWFTYNELELFKPKFDINDYPGNYCMHVNTEEQAKIFCEYLHNVGRRWRSDKAYIDHTNWNKYNSLTVYQFNDGSYADIHVNKFITFMGINNKYIILEFEDFDWSDFEMKNAFTKADLRNGDVVKFRNGEFAVAIPEIDTFLFKNGYAPLTNFDNDLIHTGITGKSLDVVKVKRPNCPADCQFSAFEHNYGTLVYERKEVEEMTLAEVCKALGKDIKIVKGE